MVKLIKYLKPYWKQALLAPLLMLVEVVMDLMQPTLTASIIDNGIYTRNIGFILHTGMQMFIIALVGAVGGIGCTVFSGIASQSFAADLRLDLFKKTQKFSFANLDRFKTASLITRLTNDVVQLQTFVLMMLRMFVRSPLLCIGGVVMVVAINPRFAIILLVVIPLLAISIAVVVKKGFPLFSAVQEKLDRVNAIMQENLAGVRVVKAYVRSDWEKARFGKANDELTDINVKASRIIALSMPIMMFIVNMSIVGVIWFGGIQVNKGNMKVGEIIALINYMIQILFSMMMFGFILVVVSRAKASADRVNEVLDTEVDLTESKNAVDRPIKEGRVDFENVSFHYRGAGGEPVLKNISFSVAPGETVAILGSTGSGKSTLVNLIPRLYDVTGGRVLVDGIDVRDYKFDTLRGAISMVLQENVLFTGTIRDNIKWGKADASDEEVIAAAKAAQAHNFIMSLPDGYDTVLGQRGVNLSGGQKQRIAIARALVKKPAILILDDSTSSVDLRTESLIRGALKEFVKKCTCFVIAQRISAVMHADRIIVMENGCIESIGTHAELMEKSSVYKEIYRSQIGEGRVANA